MEFIIASNRLCFAACLQMVLLNIYDRNIDQVEIAREFGITLPVTDTLLDRIPQARISDNPTQWGMNISPLQLDHFLQTKNIKRTFEYLPTKTFEDWMFLDIIIQKTRNFNTIVTFEYNSLFQPANKTFYGHALLLDGVKDDNLIAYDPGPYEFGVKEVSYFDLFVASKRMNGGLWIFY